LAEEGARLGCHHCQGVVAYCYSGGYGCVEDEARSLELARESSGRGSKYGQVTLAGLMFFSQRGLDSDSVQGLALYRLAAAQGLDEAQCSLGNIHRRFRGEGIVRHPAEPLRWYQLAAAQGHPRALYFVAFCHEEGRGVRKNKAAAIRWYRRAQAAGYTDAASKLQKLGV